MVNRDIYEIIVVNHETGVIVSDLTRVVATSSEAAMAKVNIVGMCEKANLSVDDVEYVILRLGSLRGVQEVTESKVSKF